MANGCPVLCSRFLIRPARSYTHCLFSSLFLSLTVSYSRIRTGGCCIRSDQGTERTTGSTTRTARSDTTSTLVHRTIRRVIRIRSSASWARLVTKRCPSNTAVIHLTMGFRDSLTFLRIRILSSTRDPRADRLHVATSLLVSSCGRQDVTPQTADGRSFVSTDEFDII